MSAEPKGFRRDIMVLHAVSDLMEKRPDLPRPQVEFAKRYGVEEKAHISWHLVSSYSDGPTWGSGTESYDEYQERRKVWQRVNLEERIAAIVDALGEGVEWEKNDPTKEEYYYKLSTLWHGARLTITTSREAVCEKVVVLETEREDEVPDPELTKTFMDAVPKVKVMVKDTITEWQCNSALAAATAPKHTRTVTAVSTT